MADINYGERLGVQQPVRVCPECNIKVRFILSLLDVKRDKFVQVYRCDPCNKEIWVE